MGRGMGTGMGMGPALLSSQVTAELPPKGASGPSPLLPPSSLRLEPENPNKRQKSVRESPFGMENELMGGWGRASARSTGLWRIPLGGGQRQDPETFLLREGQPHGTQSPTLGTSRAAPLARTPALAVLVPQADPSRSGLGSPGELGSESRADASTPKPQPAPLPWDPSLPGRAPGTVHPCCRAGPGARVGSCWIRAGIWLRSRRRQFPGPPGSPGSAGSSTGCEKAAWRDGRMVDGGVMGWGDDEALSFLTMGKGSMRLGRAGIAQKGVGSGLRGTQAMALPTLGMEASP